MKFETLNFTDNWLTFLGKPSKVFHTIIYGLPKAGKSTFCINFASYLSRNFGRTLYIAAEEGIGQTLQDKIRFVIADNNNLLFSACKTKKKAFELINSNNFNYVFIDSANQLDILPEDVRMLRNNNRNTGFQTILQATKQGDFKGNQEWAHDVDSVIKLDSGTAFQKGRFNAPSSMEIFPNLNPVT